MYLYFFIYIFFSLIRQLIPQGAFEDETLKIQKFFLKKKLEN
jgi:hypothetical protein